MPSLRPGQGSGNQRGVSPRERTPAGALPVRAGMSATPPMAGAPLIPVTLLTGFLGSGKTTILNHLLKQPDFASTAVIINEFGAVGLDHLLVDHVAEDMVLLQSGCLCCTIRGDLSRALGDLVARRDAGTAPPFTRVVVETTGLADPAPIVHTFISDIALLERYFLDGVVAAVDAVNGMGTLDSQPEAVKQVAMADRLLLTKSDLAPRDAVDALLVRLRVLNPAAKIVSAEQGHVDPRSVLDLGLFDPIDRSDDVRAWLQAEAYAHDHHHGHHHPDVNRHDDAIRAFCLTLDRAVPWNRFWLWLQLVSAMQGPDLLRVKGIVAIEDGERRPVVVHGVQHVFHEPILLDRWPDVDQRTRLVFITRNVERRTIEATLDALA
ncbi:CobW family GTP-binding protein [Zavarzinia sp. CC-PAN008]|uniref:CobW family GTP-binding protein n=1 Tax=Zavarzinia sp. CC-PAN008 TaxID=3243332 RepID=UPI003F74665A